MCNDTRETDSTASAPTSDIPAPTSVIPAPDLRPGQALSRDPESWNPQALKRAMQQAPDFIYQASLHQDNLRGIALRKFIYCAYTLAASTDRLEYLVRERDLF